MSAAKVRCPSCAAPVRTPPNDGRYCCAACDEVFELHEIPDEPAHARPPARPAPARARPPAPRPAPRPGVALAVGGAVACAALVLLVGVGAAVYFATKKGEPKEPAAAAPPKKDEPAPAKPPVPPAAPKKEPTTEEVVRRVKAATVFIRTTFSPTVGATGSGFFAGKPGFVVTNAHVLGYEQTVARRPRRVEVVVASGEAGERVLDAEVYGVDVEGDLALLRVEAAGLPAPLPFGRAGDLVETTDVVIYGFPFGELLGRNVSVNRSTVSSLRREGGRLTVVQLAGGVNPGNSGGPVTDVRGTVVGVSVAKLRGTEVAFAIPAEAAEAFVRDQHRVGGTGPPALVAIGPPPFRDPEPEPPTPTRPKPPEPPAPTVRPPEPKPPEPEPALPAVVVPDRVAGGVYGPKKGPEEVRLPGPVDDAVVGGGGRFLVFRLADGKKLAVFDARAGKVVKELPLAEDTRHFAAGADRLVVVYRGAKLIQYWNLHTLEKERSALLPEALTSDNIHQVCMGASSPGPLFVYLPGEKRTLAVDLNTLKTTQVRWNHWAPDNAYGPLLMRVSGDGAVLAGHGGGWAGCDVAFFDRGRQVGAFAGIPFWDAAALPTADGRHVFAAGRVLNRGLTQAEWDGGRNAYAVPAVEPGFVVSLQGAGKLSEVGRARVTAIAVYNEDRQKLFYLTGLDELAADPLPWEKRLFFYPRSGLLVTLGKGKDRLVLRRVDLGEELDRSGVDYLAVTSRPPAAAAGKPFAYQIEARSKKGGVTFKLGAGPDGLAVDAAGKVTWPNPAGLDRPANVVVTAADAGGQEVIHAFELGTVAPKR